MFGHPKERELTDCAEEQRQRWNGAAGRAWVASQADLGVGADEGRRHAFAVGPRARRGQRWFEMSTLTQAAAVPSRRAIATVVLPVPQPTSSS